MGRSAYGLILIHLLFALPSRADSVFAPAKANGQFVVQKTASPKKATLRSPATAMGTATTKTGMGLAVTPKPAAASSLVPVGTTATGAPAYPAQPLVGPPNISSYSGMPYGYVPHAATQPTTMNPAMLQSLMNMFNRSGSGLGGPNGGGRNATEPDYTDQNLGNGNYQMNPVKLGPSLPYTTPAGKGRSYGSNGRWDTFRCDSDSNGEVLSGTFYNSPHEDRRLSYASYTSFYDPQCAVSSCPGRPLAAVNVEGTGVRSDGRIIQFDSKGKSQENPCPEFFGESTVPTGSALQPGQQTPYGDVGSASEKRPNCLVPFFSVAADPDYYPPGTIIDVSELENHTVYLPPSGKAIKHPGLFMVQDTGSAIKKQGRFDFFTGSYEQADKKNIFGHASIDPNMRMDLHSCRNHFQAIKPGDPGYEAALRKLQAAVTQANGTGPTLAQQPTTTTAGE